MSRLLINEPPLQVLPSLAVAVGLNEAIVLQQVHYWLSNPSMGKAHEGARWIRNSASAWRETNFPFWSESTVRRILDKLEEAGYIKSEALNKSAYDRTLWYTIDYSMLPDWEVPFSQNDQIDDVNVTNSLSETTTENTLKDHHQDDVKLTDEKLHEVKTAYENEIGMLTMHISRKLEAAVEEMSKELVTEAIHVAAEHDGRSWAYIDKVLQNWKEGGRKSRHRADIPRPAPNYEGLVLADSEGEFIIRNGTTERLNGHTAP